MLLILSYNDQTDESVIPVLNKFARYEQNHESPPCYINEAEDVTSSLINVYPAVQNPKYHNNANKPVIWLRRFMKTLEVDYVKDSYQDRLQFTRDESTDVSLKQ